MSNKSSGSKKITGQTVMSTVYFFEKNLPKTIALKDCGLPLVQPIEGCFSALYGHIGRQAGFMAAKVYADKHRLNYTIIDFNVQFDKAVNTVPVGLEQLKHEELVALQRLPNAVLSKLFESYINDHHDDQHMLKSYELLVQRPELLAGFINHEDYENLKLVIYPGVTAINEKPLTIGSIPFRHWDVITSAECRLHPTTKVTLESPAPQLQASNEATHNDSESLTNRAGTNNRLRQ